jgi:hypothetical protein
MAWILRKNAQAQYGCTTDMVIYLHDYRKPKASRAAALECCKHERAYVTCGPMDSRAVGFSRRQPPASSQFPNDLAFINVDAFIDRAYALATQFLQAHRNWPSASAKEAADDWLEILPINSHGRRMLTLDRARHLALLSPTRWCIGPYRCGYAIGKQTAYPEWDLYYLVDENNEPLYFDTLDAAMHFLRTQLHVHQAEVVPTPEFAADI